MIYAFMYHLIVLFIYVCYVSGKSRKITLGKDMICELNRENEETDFS